MEKLNKPDALIKLVYGWVCRLIEKILGQQVSITTVVATFRDIRGTVTAVGDGLLEITDKKGGVLYIPISQCGTIRVIGEKKMEI